MNRALNILGALGMGAGIMYLMDPSKGPKRRKMARKQLRSTLNQTRDTFDDLSQEFIDRANKAASRGLEAAEPMREAIGDYSRYLSKRARKMSDRMDLGGSLKGIGRQASDWMEPVRDAGGRIIDRAGDLTAYADQLQGMAERLSKLARRRAATMIGARLGPTPWIYALAGIGAGALLMFIFDPQAGTGRRQLVGERVSGVLSAETTQEVQHWARRLLVQVKTMLGGKAEEEIDERLRRHDAEKKGNSGTVREPMQPTDAM